MIYNLCVVGLLHGALLACALPDTSNLRAVGEYAYFFTQHYSMVALCVCWIVRQRYALYEGARPTLLFFAVTALFHFVVLFPISLIFNTNLNYMLVSRSIESS